MVMIAGGFYVVSRIRYGQMAFYHVSHATHLTTVAKRPEALKKLLFREM
jgi:hypothetical protein